MDKSAERNKWPQISLLSIALFDGTATRDFPLKLDSYQTGSVQVFLICLKRADESLGANALAYALCYFQGHMVRDTNSPYRCRYICLSSIKTITHCNNFL